MTGLSNQRLQPTRHKPRAAGAPVVCAVHAVMLGGVSPPSRYEWSRRTREAPGRRREVGSEGSMERMGGATHRNPIGGGTQSGRGGRRAV